MNFQNSHSIYGKATIAPKINEDQIEFIEINAVYSKEWPNIVEMKDHPADAEEWNGKPGKRDLLEK